MGGGQARAREFSGAYLLQMCASAESGAELVPGGHIACQSYIAGVIDYHVLLRSLGTAPSIDFCIPDSVNLDLIQKVVALYLMRNRQHAEFVAAPAVSLALYQSWPCKTKSGKKK
ncbi:MAG: hypothetical protein H6862_04565 [Rhodospirillales bacterium]|nr:hypothetical protein [Rhodospirillales bacterium]